MRAPRTSLSQVVPMHDMLGSTTPMSWHTSSPGALYMPLCWLQNLLAAGCHILESHPFSSLTDPFEKGRASTVWEVQGKDTKGPPPLRALSTPLRVRTLMRAPCFLPCPRPSDLRRIDNNGQPVPLLLTWKQDRVVQMRHCVLRVTVRGERE